MNITYLSSPVLGQCQRHPFLGLALYVLFLILSGCATQVQQTKMNESSEQFKNGQLQNSLATIQDAFQTKNTLYYLETGQVQRLVGPKQITNSTINLRVADAQVEQWTLETNERLKRSFGDVSAYVLSEGMNSAYEPKSYEVSLLSQTLALNHITQGRWNDAMIEAKKMALREKTIEALIQNKTSAVARVQQNQQNSPNTRGASSRIQDINGYPVNLLDDEETRNLKNAYQNPSAYFLSAFIYESQGEASLAAPGYRLAFELRPSVSFFKSSLANLDANIKKSNVKKTADTLVMIDTGFMPKIIPYKVNQPFFFGNGPKIVTLTFPVIEKSTERFTPRTIQLGDIQVTPELVTNLDAMARKNLQDEMPGYVLRASTRALVSLAAQYAADQAVQQSMSKNNQNNGNAALAGAIASLITGIGLQSINVTDVRHWTTLPAQTFMSRVSLPIGPNLLKFTTPSGVVLTQTVELVGGYNVVYIRMFRDRASVLVSNDPNSLPVQSNPTALKLPMDNDSLKPAVSPASRSSNMDTLKEFERPNIFDSLKQLF